MSASETLALPTRDGLTVLNGQLDWPDSSSTQRAGRWPLLLIVPGGGFMDRDGQLGDSGTERDLVFRDLAMAVVHAGIPVLRWDLRGIRCTGLTMPPCSPSASAEAGMQHFLDHCIDQDVRRHVTPENLLTDLEQVYQHAANHPRIDPERIIVWAHSEGTLNVARLVHARRVRPHGLILVAPIVESPLASQWWLEVGRVLERVMSWDADGDGLVTRSNVHAKHGADVLFQAMGTTLEELLPDGAYWTREGLRERLEQQYAQLKTDELAIDDTAPYAFPAPAGTPSPTYASYRWRKQWFVDDTPTLGLLAGYGGAIVFHVGALDCQNPAHEQLRMLNAQLPSFDIPPAVVVHDTRGHTLRTQHPLLGPLDLEAREQLVRDVVDMVSRSADRT